MRNSTVHREYGKRWETGGSDEALRLEELSTAGKV